MVIELSSSKSVQVKQLKISVLNSPNSVHQSKHPKNTPFKALVEHYHLKMSDSHSFKWFDSFQEDTWWASHSSVKKHREKVPRKVQSEEIVSAIRWLYNTATTKKDFSFK